MKFGLCCFYYKPNNKIVKGRISDFGTCLFSPSFGPSFAREARDENLVVVGPGCGRGKLYDTGRPAVMPHLEAQPIICGQCLDLEKLRCATC
ncbi:MAG: hypothetical protein PHV34_03830 [Verrucomicrobiae bacterium]|nr:hypothetical protein [Verrucomicrobiae bacterium]